MQKRTVFIYSALALFMAGIFFKLYSISQKTDYATVSNNQSTYRLNVTTQRANIYDCNMKPLVNIEDKYIASILPSPESAIKIIKQIDKDKQDYFLSKMQENKPFLIPVNSNKIYDDGIEIIHIKNRYTQNQTASHIIGYVNGDNNGVCGIEKTYNDFLTLNSNKISVFYNIDAQMSSFNGVLPHVDFGDVNNKYGVVLTLDKRIQKIAENSSKSITKGAIVVMDPQTGDLKAVVSIPNYNPNNISAYLSHPDCPLLNRAFQSYNVGSTFKLLVSAAALEQDYNKFINFSATCVGYKEIGKNIFKCHYENGHGTINMSKALQISCNPYFIELALKIGPSNILDLCQSLGFGHADILSNDIKTSPGHLPSKNHLITDSDIANFGFGQGELMATPIQIAKMISIFANDGYVVIPRLIKGLSDKNGKNIESTEKIYSQNKILSTKTTQAIKNFMIDVVENGSGKKAKPNNSSAGGKTASAQTGHFDTSNPEKEIVHAWFAGFFPADNPKYTIVVFSEGGESGSDITAPIFKKIADDINNLK